MAQTYLNLTLKDMGMFEPFLAYFSKQNCYQTQVTHPLSPMGHSKIIIIIPGDIGGHRTSLDQEIVNLKAKNWFLA